MNKLQVVRAAFMKEVEIFPSKDTEITDKWETVIYIAAASVFIVNTIIQLAIGHTLMGVLWFLLAVLYASYFLFNRLPFVKNKVFYSVNNERVSMRANLLSPKKELAFKDIAKMKVETNGIRFYLNSGGQCSFRFNQLVYDDFMNFRNAILENGKEQHISLAN